MEGLKSPADPECVFRRLALTSLIWKTVLPETDNFNIILNKNMV